MKPFSIRLENSILFVLLFASLVFSSSCRTRGILCKYDHPVVFAFGLEGLQRQHDHNSLNLYFLHDAYYYLMTNDNIDQTLLHDRLTSDDRLSKVHSLRSEILENEFNILSETVLGIFANYDIDRYLRAKSMVFDVESEILARKLERIEILIQNEDNYSELAEITYEHNPVLREIIEHIHTSNSGLAYYFVYQNVLDGVSYVTYIYDKILTINLVKLNNLQKEISCLIHHELNLLESLFEEYGLSSEYSRIRSEIYIKGLPSEYKLSELSE